MSLAVREMQTKTALRFLSHPNQSACIKKKMATNVGKDVVESGAFVFSSKNVK